MSFIIPTPTVRLKTPSCLASYPMGSLWDPMIGKIRPSPITMSGPAIAGYHTDHLGGQ